MFGVRERSTLVDMSGDVAAVFSKAVDSRLKSALAFLALRINPMTKPVQCCRYMIYFSKVPRGILAMGLDLTSLLLNSP